VSAGRLWWTPATGAPLVSLSVRVGRMQVAPERQGVGSLSLGGAVRHATLGQSDRVSVTLSPPSTRPPTPPSAAYGTGWRPSLTTCCAARPSGSRLTASVAWAGKVTGYLGTAGATGLAAAQALPAGVAGTMVVGGRVVLRDLGGVQRREVGRLASSAAPLYSLADGVTAGFSGPILARERGTYPALRLAEDARGRVIVADADGLVYRVTLELRQDIYTELEVVEAGAEQAAQAMAVVGPSAQRSWRPTFGASRWTP
jgi:hypothetical protein